MLYRAHKMLVLAGLTVLIPQLVWATDNGIIQVWTDASGFKTAANCSTKTTDTIGFAVVRGQQHLLYSLRDDSKAHALLDRTFVSIINDERTTKTDSHVKVIDVSQPQMTAADTKVAARNEGGLTDSQSLKDLSGYVFEIDKSTIKSDILGTYWQAAMEKNKFMIAHCELPSKTDYVLFDVFAKDKKDPITMIGLTMSDTALFASAQVYTTAEAEKIVSAPDKTPTVSVATTPAPTSTTSTPAPPPVAKGIEVHVNKKTQNMIVLLDGKQQFSTPVSTGMPGHATSSSPKGKFFSIGEVSPAHPDRQFPGAILYWALQFNGGQFIHAASAGRMNYVRKRQAHSHGCVSIPPKYAKQLFELVKKVGKTNARVYVD